MLQCNLAGRHVLAGMIVMLMSACHPDADGDGAPLNSDCDDNDPVVGDRFYDNDCDGLAANADCNDNDPASFARAADEDCDGVSPDDDCDDKDARSTTVASDADCDGVVRDDDCDDADPLSLARSVDGDCDKVPRADDCDDNDWQIGSRADDGDCDGANTAVDCDDASATSTVRANDADCDGVRTTIDCDDNNVGAGLIALDADCDGITTAADCDDRDRTSTTVATDADCDGLLTAADCDDADDASTSRADDADCDGALTADDCDDTQAVVGARLADRDCDGALRVSDCDDANPLVGDRATDADCDGALAVVDCNDADPAAGSSVDDADCDGVATADDCDDGDAASLIRALDADCDGFTADVDCDDTTPGTTSTVTDADCDGAEANDCDDADPALGDRSQDADCDGALAWVDCDDGDAAVADPIYDADCDGVLVQVDCDDADPGIGLFRGDADCDGVLDHPLPEVAILTATVQGPMYVAMTAGEEHACGLRPDHTLRCWGQNGRGQLDLPTDVSWLSVAANQYSTCGIDAGGEIHCVGAYAQDPPLQVSADTGGWGGPATTTQLFRAVDLADRRYGDGFAACAIPAYDEGIVCWGDDPTLHTEAPVTGSFVEISVGAYHACARGDDDRIVCWGSNDQGQLDDLVPFAASVSAGMNETCTLSARGVPSCSGGSSGWWSDWYAALTDVPRVRISLDDGYGCALGGNLELRCAGSDYYSQVTTAPRGGRWLAVDTDWSTACALRADGQVRCWGDDGKGWLGGYRELPGGIKEVVVGDPGICALNVNREIACLGGSVANVPPGAGYSGLSMHGDAACAINANREVVCWGAGRVATDTPAIAVATHVSVGSGHACATDYASAVKCWGGDPAHTTPPPNLEAHTVAVGESNTCAIDRSRAVVCWGNDLHGEVSEAPSSGRWLELAAGTGGFCATSDSDELYCWPSSSPMASQAPTGNFVALAGGDTHACALDEDGRIVCFGADTSGVVADTPPDAVYEQVSAGNAISCGLTRTGLVDCWGSTPLGANFWGGAEDLAGTQLAREFPFQATVVITLNNPPDCPGCRAQILMTMDSIPVACVYDDVPPDAPVQETRIVTRTGLDLIRVPGTGAATVSWGWAAVRAADCAAAAIEMDPANVTELGVLRVVE